MLMGYADIPITRYKVEFVCPSTGNVGSDEVDAYSAKDARDRVRRSAHVRIDITGVSPIGRGGQTSR
jgi:hypothetical protein